MSQAQTLQNIYLKIADIYDKFCEGLTASDSDPETMITTQLSINETTWVTNGLTFSNPNADPKIGAAQLEINSVLAIALDLAKAEMSQYDESTVNSQGVVVPIPKGSPIMLLPKLIKLLVLYKAPLKFLMNILLDYIKEVILEHIKRKLLEKQGEFFDVVDVASTQLIKIPKTAEKMIIAFNNLPEWIGKRFEPTDLNKSIIQPPPSVTPDLSKFILTGLGTVNFGLALTGTNVSATVFWGIDLKLEYRRQIFDIPVYEDFANHQRYAYLYLEHANTCTIGFLRRV